MLLVNDCGGTESKAYLRVFGWLKRPLPRSNYFESPRGSERKNNGKTV